jgi:SPP1 family predicted phage head-tail adaptor
MPTLGQLDERITIKSATEVFNALNEPTLTWASHMTAWARVMPLSGLEALDRGVRNAEATYRVFILHRADKEADVGMRIFWTPRHGRVATEKTLDVVYVRRVTGHLQFSELLCKDHT